MGDAIPRAMLKWRGFFLLSRPVNVLIAMASIFIGAIISGSIEPLARLLMACFAGGLITAAANAINDFFDVEIDVINKPERPLPQGIITPREAFNFSMVLFLTGIMVSFFVNRAAYIIAGVFSLLLYFYSAYLKRTVLVGNITVSLATAFAFIFGAISVGRFQQSLIPAGFAFMMHLGREIIKDMEDVKGDRLNNAKTLPVVFGFAAARWVATIVFSLLIVATLMPKIYSIYGNWYFLIVMLGVNSVLVLTISAMWQSGEKTNLRLLSALLKADMVVGLAAIYAGKW